MLVLSRKAKQAVISQGMIVRVLEIRGSTVRLGFTAPMERDFVREELLDTVGVRELFGQAVGVAHETEASPAVSQ